MNVLIDTGFWYAYYNERDPYHDKAVNMMPFLEKHTIIIPYPSLYEKINTRFAKRKEWMDSFKVIILSPMCLLINDEKYKKEALSMTMETCIEKGRPISLVDMVIRQMLDDVNLKSDAIVTFNPGDFYDICLRNKIRIISNSISKD